MTNNTRTVTGVVTSTRRLKSSRYGNPRFAVTIGEQEYKTAPDVMLAYGIRNHVYKEREHAFELNGRGNIVSAMPVDAH